mgnify:CR=1 FL=1
MSENQTTLQINSKEEVAFKLYRDLCVLADKHTKSNNDRIQDRINLFCLCLDAVKGNNKSDYSIPYKDQKQN